MNPMAALLVFAGWAVGLVFAVVLIRTAWVLQGTYKANGFKSGEQHGPAWYWRLNRAHTNAIETLVPFAVVVGAGVHLGVDAPFGTLAWATVAARVCQTGIHVALDTHLSVSVRATFFLVQVGLIVAMGVQLVPLL